MKKIFILVMMAVSNLAASGEIYKTKDNFTNEEIVWFTNKNRQDGRIFITATDEPKKVRIGVTAPPGNTVDCRNMPIRLRDKNGKIHDIVAEEGRSWCYATVEAELFTENFMLRIPLFRGYADISVDAKNFDPTILTK